MRSRHLATCLVAATVAALIPSGAASTEVVQFPAFERAIHTFGKAQDRTVTIPAHLPVPATTSGIGPGSHLLIEFASEPDFIYGCTANFVWQSGTTRYLGAAGHCFVPETKTATHGPGADYNAAETTVRVCVSGCAFGGLSGFSIQGTTVALTPVVYARRTMGDSAIGNDFGVVTIPTALHPQIRPSVPVWGGPTSSGTITTGGLVCLYGNGAGVGETFATMARAGIGITNNSDYWTADLPSMIGDSGAAIVTCGQDSGGLHGFKAAGILTHLTPQLGFIAGTTMSRAIALAAQRTGLTITPVMGT